MANRCEIFSDPLRPLANQQSFENSSQHHPAVSSLQELQLLDPFYRHYKKSITPYVENWKDIERELLEQKHDLRNEFIQVFVLYLEIGNEDIFKILHLVSEDFNNEYSRLQLFAAFEKYFLSQKENCIATRTFYPVTFPVWPNSSGLSERPRYIFLI